MERCSVKIPNELTASGLVFNAYAKYAKTDLGNENHTVEERVFRFTSSEEKRNYNILCKQAVGKCMIAKGLDSSCFKPTKKVIADTYHRSYVNVFRKVFNCQNSKSGAASFEYFGAFAFLVVCGLALF